MNRIKLEIVLALPLIPIPASAGELDQNGREQSWRHPGGELTVIEFAAAWCVTCCDALPRLQRFARAHPELRVLVVSVDETRTGRDHLVAKLELPVVWDQHHRFAEHFQPEAMATTLVVDPEGDELFRRSGSSDAEWQRLVTFLDRSDPRK